MRIKSDFANYLGIISIMVSIMVSIKVSIMVSIMSITVSIMSIMVSIMSHPWLVERSTSKQLPRTKYSWQRHEKP